MSNDEKFDEKGHILKSKIKIINEEVADINNEFNGLTDGFDGIYFRWLIDKIDPQKCKSYSSLLMQLFQTKFRESSTVKMDVNRARDGVSLRKDFLDERGITFNSLGSPECSWLEMLIGLSKRIDDQMMYDMNLGNRTDKWFWLIIDQMDLKYYSNKNYIFDEVAEILDKLERRDYGNNGKNGIFKCSKDVRKTDIWYQMMNFFNEIGAEIEY